MCRLELQKCLAKLPHHQVESQFNLLILNVRTARVHQNLLVTRMKAESGMTHNCSK